MNSAGVVVPIVPMMPRPMVMAMVVTGVWMVVAVIVPIVVVVVVVPVSVWAMGVVPSVVCLSSRCKQC